MLAFIVATFLVGSEAGSVTSVKPSPGNLAQELYDVSSTASGSRLCDRKRAARSQKRFDLHFGERIRTLVKIHEARYGRDPDFVILNPCFRPAAGYDQNRALRDFEPRLRELEKKYGAY
jgi:hypothetical protein